MAAATASARSAAAGDSTIRASEALAFPVQLFVDRARASLDSFKLTDAGTPAIALCHRLDGIPLAIELPAARVDVFGVTGLAAQLDNSLSLLTRGRRTARARHRTLRATLDWSFDLLPEVERIILARLGVFKTTFSRKAAITIASDEMLTAEAILDGLSNLAAKSMVFSSYAAAGFPIGRSIRRARIRSRNLVRARHPHQFIDAMPNRGKGCLHHA